jgi:hypothetical protein
MKYEVRCACGKALAVTGADAGASLRCACGCAVEVPPLHELRTAAGQEVLSPVVRLRTMLPRGELPGTDECVCCYRRTGSRVKVVVECERAVTERPEGLSPFGCSVLGLLLGWIVIVWDSRPYRVRGEEIVFTLPLPVCDVCRPILGDRAELRKGLGRIPEYAALLDRYPNAQIALIN